MNKKQQRYRIVNLDRDGLPSHIEIPAPKFEHDWTNYPSSNADEVISRAKGADILVVNKVSVNAAILEACPTVKHVAVCATGYNIIDIAACESRGISVSNIPSYAATTVSEHVIASALVLRREINRYRQAVINGKWQNSPAFCLFDKPFLNLRGATMGLIGLGEIGEATAKHAKALGMTVLFSSRSQRSHDFAKQVDLDQLLSQSDVVSIHCSLNETSKGLIGERQLALLPRHAILINTARGGIVDEQAVVDAIHNESIAGIAFDVLEQEPPIENSPLLSISHQPHVLITPHISWASEQAMQYLANTLTRNIEEFAAGAPTNLVTTS